MDKLFFNKKYSGTLWAIAIAGAFVLLSLWGLQLLKGTAWYVFSSILRLVFGIVILFVIRKLYGTPAKAVLSIKGSKKALLAGLGFLLFFIYYLIIWFSGLESVKGLTAGLLVSQILLQQITTGFYEELNYRALILQGYFHGPQTVKRRVFYAFVSFLLFGALHIIDGWSTYRFLQTGTIGFAFAVMYLKSGNILVPMLLHFVYDVFANLTNYIQWNGAAVFVTLNANFHIALMALFVVSFVLLLADGRKKAGQTREGML